MHRGGFSARRPIGISVFAVVLLAGPALGVYSQAPLELEAQLASWTIINRFARDFSGAEPVNVPFSQARSFPGGLGLGFRLNFGRWLRLEPGLQVALQEYILSAAGKAVPTGPESSVIAESAGTELAQVAHLLIPVPFLFELDTLGPPESGGASFSAGGRIGPALLIRVPVWIPGGSGGTTMNGIASYLLGGGRFLYWEIGAGGSYRLSRSTVVSLRLRSYWPLSTLWSAEGALFEGGRVPITDGLIVSAELGIRFRRATQTPAQ